MRIRSIKPEFWRSEDISGLDWPTRLVFIGLWSYVDDNGVGKDNERAITADLFALEDDPRDTLATVSRALASLANAKLIERYSVAGRSYLHVATWNAHQKIDRPGKERYPLPTSADAVPRDTLATPSRDIRDTLDLGTGNRGTGEQGAGDLPAPPADADNTADALIAEILDDAPETAQTLIGEWIDHCDGQPPRNVVGQVAKITKGLLDEGIPYADVRAGLADWHERRLHPSTIPSVVHNVRQGVGKPRNGKPTPTERVVSILELGERLQAQDDARAFAHPEVGA